MKIAEKIKMATMGVAAVSTLAVSALVAPSVNAETPANRYTGSAAQQAATGDDRDLMSILNLIINVALGVIGFVAVVMIIMGGIQYTTSSGDAAKVTKAKNTIMYGVVGLVIALLAFAIVNFILTNVFNAS
ncbi:hypothetical protein IKE84_02440 [Candidatus Saccharibacteria bacterium]|nr:hypothetical protein [Candidatus Saccharibacteria bacterium]